jgi:hypothetical protein
MMAAAAAAAAAAPASNLIEPRRGKAYFTFGRYQPPTVGHQKLINEMIARAEAEGADAYVFPSSKHESAAKLGRSLTPANKWPINAGMKYSMFKEHYGGANKVRIITTASSPFAAVKALRDVGYGDITIFLGSDQVYPSAENPKPLGVSLKASYPALNIVSVARDQTLGNTPEGISGTKMRQAALAGNLNRFAAGVGMPPNKAAPYMSQLLSHMGKGGKRRSRSRRHTKKKTAKARR